MGELFLTRLYLDDLRWNKAGSLASANSAFGLVIRNKAGDFWIVENGTISELIDDPEANQMLVRHQNGDEIGLIPIQIRPTLKDRFQSVLTALKPKNLCP